jgi:diguanylate cyclase (GGDEF)-like protein/PAS domain S-box-containing protein
MSQLKEFEYIFENARVGMAIYNGRNNRLEAVNPAFAKIYGYEPHELIGESPCELFAKGCKLRTTDQEGHIICSVTKDASFEAVHTRRDGTPIVVSVHITVIRDENGVIKHRISNIIDITDKKHEEEKLRDSELKLRQTQDKLSSFISTIPDVVWMKDKNGAYVTCNRAFEKFFNTSKENILGKTDYDFFKKEEADICKHSDLEAIAAGEVCISEEIVYNPKNNTTTILEVRKAPVFGHNKELMGVMGIGRDVTEQKNAKQKLEESELLFRSIVQNLPGFAYIFKLHPDGKEEFLYLSEGVVDIYGPTPDTIKNDISALRKLIHEDDIPHFKATMSESARTLTPFYAEFRVNHPQKGELWIESRSTPEAQDDGSVVWHGITMDVTGRKLYQSKAELVGIAVNHTDEAVYVSKVDGDGKITFTFVNDIACKMLGYHRAELLCMGPLDIDVKPIKSDTSAMEWQEQATFESYHKAKDGQLIPVEISKNKFLYSGEIFTISIVRDITERKKQEELLHAKEQEFRALVENAPNPILRYDKECRRVYANSALLSLCGRSAEDILGATPKEKPILSAKEAEKLDTVLQLVVSSKEATDNEIELVTKKGDSILLHCFYTPEFGTDGELSSILTIAYDITERKRHDELLRSKEQALLKTTTHLASLVNTIPDMVWMKDPEGVYLACNHKFELFFGAPESEILGKSDYDFVDKELADLFRSYDKKALEEGGVSENEETITLKNSEQPIWLETRKVAVRDNNGDVIGILGIAKDITDRKKMEEQINKQKDFQNTLLAGIADAGIGVHVIENGKYTYTNDVQKAKKYGYDETIFELKPDFLETIHPNDKAKVLDMYRRRLAGEDVPSTYEVAVVQTNGEAIKHSISVVVIPNTDPVQTIVVTQDITERKRAEAELQRKSNLLQSVLGSSPDVTIFALDKEYRYAAFNQKHADTIKAIWGKDIAIGENMLSSITRPDDWQKAKELFDRALSGECFIDETQYGDDDLSRSYWQTYYSPMRDDNGETIGLTCFNIDITEKRESEKMLYMLTNSLNSSSESIFIIDFDTAKFIYVNNAAAKTLEYSEEELIEHMGVMDVDPEVSMEVWTQHIQDIKKYKVVNMETKHRSKSGRVYPVNVIAHYFEYEGKAYNLAVARDITEKKEVEQQIEFLAYHDYLTSLPNRILAKDRTEQAIAKAKRENSKVALLFIDLDDFKLINDSLGHIMGDTMLRVVASRLKESIRESDTISRLGGDEFLVVLTDVQGVEDASVAAEKLLGGFEKTFCLGSHILSSSISVGISMYPDDGDNFDTLLQQADTAMYKSKELGKGSYCFFAEQMNTEIIEHLQIQKDLKKAIANEEFILYYQPQIDLERNKISGVEALIRWKHPEYGLVPPIKFIPAAESSGLIVQIGEWVVKEACRQAMLWSKNGIELTMAVNISAVQFKRGNLEDVVKAALLESGLDPKFLELELTESILIDDTEKVLEAVQRLKALGMQLSIDDFGTGYSSLSYLKTFAVDKLKIDQSFVRDMVNDQEDAAIVRAVIQMAKSLNLKTIAEGVENAEALDILGFHGCDEVQGYHFAKPMEAKDFEKFWGEGGF